MASLAVGGFADDAPAVVMTIDDGDQQSPHVGRIVDDQHSHRHSRAASGIELPAGRYGPANPGSGWPAASRSSPTQFRAALEAAASDALCLIELAEVVGHLGGDQGLHDVIVDADGNPPGDIGLMMRIP